MTELVARTEEQEHLVAVLAGARAGAGRIVLLGGDAGVGKTRLAAEAASGWDGRVLTGAAVPGAAPYGPLVAALRSLLRTDPRALDGRGPLADHLHLLLPELGPPPPATDRATIYESVCRALAHLATEDPVLVVLDDLHWSDQATPELLG